MGVPKFFRWMSERYPLCSLLAQDNSIPVFDNLYLDMNGIIHNCSHGNSDDVHMRISQEKIFINIFTYISHLFTIIKPKKLFFMAIDGVAPRAKINQQRSRRFRTAHEAEEAVRKALSKGEELPEEPAFDSNCITPGTDFMMLLSEQLRYFINKKLNEDPSWHGCEIVLSGPDVPGEGEHKIMEYIRLSRSQSDYNPNTRHCLYGLDADLIMLGLLSHDPHFCLLREEVVFGPAQQRQQRLKSVEEQKFYLLHLSILREYLEKEFASIVPQLPFQFSVENVIDDFILMALFVGNDFLPHLPELHINEGALALMFDYYKQALPSMGGYMNEQGRVRFDRLEKLMQLLADWERRQYSETHPRHHRGGGHKRGGITARQKQIVEQIKAFHADTALDSIMLRVTSSDDDDVSFVKRLVKDLGMLAEQRPSQGSSVVDITVRRQQQSTDSSDDDDDEESHLAQLRVLKRYSAMPVVQSVQEEAAAESAEFERLRADYYREKLGITDRSGVERLAGFYLQGMQWVMDYYYNGVQSWNWFFPYHYSPRVTDLVPGSRQLFEQMPPFEMGEPFSPFEQLLAVLPARSKILLPEPLRELMFEKSSPILDFYPQEFETDLNGKKNDWEAVVKIPFVDEKRLLAAMKPKLALITAEQRKRSEFGKSLKFRFDPNCTPHHLRNSLTSPLLPDVVKCMTVVEQFYLPTVKQGGLLKSLHPETLVGRRALPGFPSLYTLPHSAHIARAGVKVFQSESKTDNVIITLTNTAGEEESIEQLCSSLLGTRVYVNWPYLWEAVVAKVSDETFEYTVGSAYHSAVYPLPQRPVPSAIVKQPHSNVDDWQRMAQSMEDEHMRRKGISIGPVRVILHVAQLKQMKLLDNGALVKEFNQLNELKPFPLQTIVRQVECEDERFIEQPAPPIELQFPVGFTAFYLGGGESTDNNNDAALYGSLVRVVGHQRRSLRVEVVKRQLCSLDISQQDISSRLDGRYLSAHQTAKRIQCSTLAVSRLTASVYMSLQQPQQPAHKMDVGLKVKFEGKQLKVLGYTRRTQQRGWEFSERCVELLQSYRDAFPQLFSALAASGASGAEDIDAMQVFNCSAQEARLQMDRISEWMTVNAVRKLSTVPVAVEMLGGELMQELESLVCIKLAAAAAAVETPSQVLTVPVQFLLTSSQALLRLSANQQRFSIGDRVLFVADSGAAGAIQSGASGTVVGLDAQQQQQQFRPNYRNGNRNNATEQQQQPPSNEEWIHVLLDQPAIGASDFGGMCSAGRGITVKSCALLNLSTPQPPVHRGWRQNTADSRTASTTGGFSPKQQQYKQQQRQSPVILQRPQQTTERRPKENVWQKRGARREILDSLLAARPTTNNANTSVSNATAPTTSTPASNTSPSNTPNANGRKRNEKKKEDVSNQLKSMLRIGGAEVTTIQAPQQTVVKQQPSPPQQQQPKQIPPWLLSALPTSVLQSAAAARDSSNVSEKNKQ